MRGRWKRAARGLDGAVAANELGLEEADLAHDLAVEVALAQPALRLDETQIDVDAEHPLELLAHAVGEFTAQERTAGLDQRAHLADEFGAGGTQFCHGGDLLF